MKAMMSGAAPVLAALVLAGCTSTGAEPDRGMPPPIDCGAAALQDRVGQQVTGSTAADVRIDGVPVQSRGSVRVIAPGQAVTMDFNAERLNLETDSTGRLVRAHCA